ncbi:hypothetical protein [Dyella flagellata]|uniref:Major facilitator superfamily (MFS) profile domain-containing protein n=1 Tax=Dyella flagellata TaxID=1867833 RepID=A0ABQ5XFB3_9GAMM|nr:hypothetical protein [Dyella flagellata]GLQ90217.1 hypothetical protein GCM10007898_37920 [Dyella flagellata]
MSGSQKWRAAMACLGLIALAGACFQLPALFKMVSVGEMTIIMMMCIVIGMTGLLVGVLRFLTSASAKGAPFALAFSAFIPGLMGPSFLRLSLWFALLVSAAVFGALVGFLTGGVKVTAGS